MRNIETRDIPKKNYVILGIVLLLSLLFIYYLYMWYDAYQDNLLSKPILNKYMEMINYNELNDYLAENQDTIIYVSILENEEIRDFEKNFRKELKRNTINREILYMDITDDIKNPRIKNDMVSKYTINGSSMINVPAVMVFEKGSLKAIYNIANDEYDINELKTFINSVCGDN